MGSRRAHGVPSVDVRRPVVTAPRARPAPAPHGPLSRDGVVVLQRLAGNRAVTRHVVQRVGVGDLGGLLRRALSPPLKRGDRGATVLLLQQSLNKVGAALIEDGFFGPACERAVVAFQSDHGLRPVGSLNQATWDAIRAGGPSTTSAGPGLGSTESWRSMSAEKRADWTTLGYTAATWKAKTLPLTMLLPFGLLSVAQRAAATRLGYTRANWKANQDKTAAATAKAFGAEEAAAKKKAGAGVLPAKFVGSLRAKAMLEAEFGGDVDIQLPKVHLLTPAQMQTAWEGIYGAGTYTPVNGFTVKPDIYLNQGAVWAGTTVHESLHIQEHSAWDAFAYRPTTAFGEGATTILTERTMTRHGRTIDQHSYPAQVALVSKMNSHAGLDKMRAAYFKGAVADYQTAVTAGLRPGTTWAQFRALVNAGALAAAQARLK